MWMSSINRLVGSSSGTSWPISSGVISSFVSSNRVLVVGEGSEGDTSSGLWARFPPSDIQWGFVMAFLTLLTALRNDLGEWAHWHL
jgi:hypothetical protein